MNIKLSFISLALFASFASAQGFTKLEVVRTDASGDPADGRRKLTLTIGGDWRVSYTAAYAGEGAPGTWKTPSVQGSNGISRHKRQDELSGLVKKALEARPTGTISGTLDDAKRAGLNHYAVAIDATRFELHEGSYATPELEAAVGPLVAAVDAMLAEWLPPMSFYTKLTYTRGGKTLEISPTGTTSVVAGGDVTFHDLSKGPLNKLQALIKESGLFVPANQGKKVALQTRSGASGPAFELEVFPLRQGESYQVSGTVGSYAGNAKAAGALIDYLEKTLTRLSPGTAAGGTSGGGMGNALEGQ